MDNNTDLRSQSVSFTVMGMNFEELNRQALGLLEQYAGGRQYAIACASSGEAKPLSLESNGGNSQLQATLWEQEFRFDILFNNPVRLNRE